MDRLMVYPGAIPLDTDQLTPQVSAMTALGWLLQSVMGTASGVVGLPCAPTSPASMVVNVGAGAMWAQEEIDPTAFGSLAADTSPLMKMGILPEGAGTNFTLTAPLTSGYSINYLIEATFQETDGTPVVLPYVNPADPANPFSGPNNSGTAQNTTRKQTVALQLKPGAAAATGTQTTPAVDTGYVGLYVITVAYGQTTVTSGNISTYSAAPFVQDLPTVGGLVNTLAAVDGVRGVIETSGTGTAYSIASGQATLSDGMSFWVQWNVVSGASPTLADSTSGTAAAPIVVMSGGTYAAPPAGSLAAAGGSLIQWDATNTRWIVRTPRYATAAEAAAGTATGLLMDPALARIGAFSSNATIIETTGTGTAYSFASGLSALTDGATFPVIWNVASGTSPTLADSSSGTAAAPIVALVGGSFVAPTAGNLAAGGGSVVRWDAANTRWIVQTPLWAVNGDTTSTGLMVDPAFVEAALGTALPAKLVASINFNGTGTPVIGASLNISSITKNGTGDYTLNFTTALGAANYVVVFGTIAYSSSNLSQVLVVDGTVTGGPALKTTTQLRILCGSSSSGALIDASEINVAIFL